MGVRKTSVEINEDLLAAAQDILSTTTVKETVEMAFREVVQAQARREEVRALTSMEGMDLADADLMRQAWRS